MVSYLNREKKLDSIVGTRPAAPPAPRGLYLYGSVGSGMHVLQILALCSEIFWYYSVPYQKYNLLFVAYWLQMKLFTVF